MKLQEFFLQGLFCIFIFTGSSQVHTASVGKATDFLIPVCACVPACRTGVSDYQIPRPNLFNGSTDSGTDCAPAGDILECFVLFVNSTLTDGDIGPPHSLSMNLHRFIAWNRTQTQSVWIHVTCLITVQCCTVVLQLSCTTDRSTNHHF